MKKKDLPPKCHTLIWCVLFVICFIDIHNNLCVYIYTYIYRIWHDPEAWLGDWAGGTKRRNFPWTKRHQAPTTCSEFCEIGGVEWKRSSFERPNVLIKNPKIKIVRGNPPKMTCVQDLGIKITRKVSCGKVEIPWNISKNVQLLSTKGLEMSRAYAAVQSFASRKDWTHQMNFVLDLWRPFKLSFLSIHLDKEDLSIERRLDGGFIHLFKDWSDWGECLQFFLWHGKSFGDL